MSSAISTEKVGLKTDAAPDQSLQPWQFFVLVALACATVVTFMVRGQGLTSVILLSALIGCSALVGLAGLRTVRPLVDGGEDRTPMIGERTRAALEREKMLALRAIKDLEFDRAMGKMSEEDFREMTARLRSRAGRLIRQLDSGAGYRDQIERELAKRLPAVPAAGVSTGGGADASAATSEMALRCASCRTLNDVDARFCKGCGAKL